MKTISFFALAAVIGATFFTGCSTSHVAAYSGPRKPEAQIALIPYDEAQNQIRVISVDGKRVNSRKADVAMLPGHRVVEVVYTPPKTAHSYPVRVTFEAEAGHQYALSAQMLKGQLNDEGYWGGKYQVFAYDLASSTDFHGVREVGRSPGPDAVASRE